MTQKFPRQPVEITRPHSRRTFIKTGVGGAVAASGLLGAGRSFAQSAKPAFKLKFGHPYNEKHPLAKGAVMFSQLVKERTNGQVEVTVYPNSTIGSSQPLFQAMQIDAVDVALVPTTDVATFFKPLNVLYFPFIFSDRQQAYRFCDGKVAASLSDEMAKATGVRWLTTFESGFRTITTRKVPIRQPDDLKKVKIRVPNSPINVETFRALGTNPTPIALSELFTALEQGTVDGQDNPVGNVYAFGYYKVQDYITLSRHQWAGICFLMSNSVLGKLPEDIRNIVSQAAKDSCDWEREAVNEEEQGYLDLMAKEGFEVIELTDDERKAFRNKTTVVWDKFGKDLPAGLVQSVQDA